MSVQLHTETQSSPAASAGLFARLRWGVRARLRDPNPVWIRELKQSARLGRTPIILAVVTCVMTLLIASIGGVLSVTAEPAQVGIGVFHTFFSLAFAVVTWVGPAVAATTIASERSGRTWEALLLTSLPPTAIARGKFMAALTYVCLYVVMLAPVGGLAFLFGGITPAEVLLAFVVLFLIAALSVAFGLAMSSAFSSPAVAILVTLFVAVPASILVYLLGGVGLSFPVHDLWPGVLAGGPVWLPTAYVRADFSLSYIVFLVLWPLVAASVPSWLLYEVTAANMAAPSDDRSTRLRVWTLVTAPALALVIALSCLALRDIEWTIAGLTLAWVFFGFVAFLIAGEPLGPTARVEARWLRERVGRLARWLGPGVGRAAALAFALCVGCLASLTLLGFALASSRDDVYSVVGFGGYALGFSVFMLGFASSCRARAQGAAVPRVLLAGALFLALLGPYIALAIGGVLTDGDDRMALVAAPSPAFAFALVQRLRSPGGDADYYVIAAAAASLGWALVGLGLLLDGARQARRRWIAERAERDGWNAAAPTASTPTP